MILRNMCTGKYFCIKERQPTNPHKITWFRRLKIIHDWSFLFYIQIFCCLFKNFSEFKLRKWDQLNFLRYEWISLFFSLTVLILIQNIGSNSTAHSWDATETGIVHVIFIAVHGVRCPILRALPFCIALQGLKRRSELYGNNIFI